MANPFPSDWSLTSPKEDTAPPAKQLPFTIRTFSFRNALDYCASQIFSRFSTDADSPLPALEHSSSTRDSSPPSTPITPGEYTTEHSFGVGTAAVAAVVPSSSSSSAQSKRQRSQDELRSLSDSQLGLQLAILLPERMCASPLSVGVSEEEKTSCPPQLQPQGQRHARQRMTLRQSEGPSGAIPFLDLDAVQEVDEASSCRAAAPEAEVSGGGSSDNGGDDGDGDAMRLNAAAGSVASRSRGSRCELAESARRCVAPRDLLFS